MHQRKGKGSEDSMTDLTPCPFCGAGETHFDENGFWSGDRKIVIAVELRHWCAGADTKERRGGFVCIQRKTKDEVIAVWNVRTA
jgi:hypothetical protein